MKGLSAVTVVKPFSYDKPLSSKYKTWGQGLLKPKETISPCISHLTGEYPWGRLTCKEQWNLMKRYML